MENGQVQLIYHTKPYKMMVLCNNLLSDSENRSTYQPFPVVCLCLEPGFIGAVISGIKVYTEI